MPITVSVSVVFPASTRNTMRLSAGPVNCPSERAASTLGSAGIGTLRAPSFFNFDSAVGKKFNLIERQYFDFRVELFNAFNHASWGAPGRDITNPAGFGQITSQIQNPRNIQFGLKY